MTDKDMREIVRLRGARMGYGRISHQLGIPLSMVKSYCRRNNLFGSAGEKVCMQCDHPLEQVPHRKKKKEKILLGWLPDNVNHDYDAVIAPPGHHK